MFDARIVSLETTTQNVDSKIDRIAWSHQFHLHTRSNNQLMHLFMNLCYILRKMHLLSVLWGLCHNVRTKLTPNSKCRGHIAPPL
jgi:hypothetical protein